MRFLFGISTLPLLLFAQGPQSRVAGPTMGYLWDSGASSLSRVVGVPGAARVEDPIDLGFTAALAAPAPRQDYVLAVDAGTGAVKLVRVANGAVVAVNLDGAPPAPDRIVFSPTGTAAALYYAASAGVTLVAGLPDAPSPAASIDLSALADTPGAIAPNDDGSALLAAAGNNVYVLGSGAAPRSVLAVSQISALSFAAGGSDAVMADTGANQVILLHDATGAAQPQILAGPDDGIASPGDVAFSDDKQRVFVANTGAGAVLIVDLQQGGNTSLACACSPARLARISGGFRLNDPPAAPLWLLDTGSAGPRIVFLPPRVDSGRDSQ